MNRPTKAILFAGVLVSAIGVAQATRYDVQRVERVVTGGYVRTGAGTVDRPGFDRTWIWDRWRHRLCYIDTDKPMRCD